MILKYTDFCMQNELCERKAQQREKIAWFLMGSLGFRADIELELWFEDIVVLADMVARKRASRCL